ncbi:MAG: hypothetical protein K0S55_1953, partial [Clostridia bacterium]|nr:hypothetical protein [Clostridia bacterium]
AIKDFKLDINHKIALDCGASTGGFTDCLIEHGADFVYAVDVGFGQLAGKLLLNNKVVNMEKTNLSDKCLLNLTPNPDIITLDLSYLSLKAALPLCINILKGEGNVITLIKPIFEVDSKETRRTGKINECDLLKNILIDLCHCFLNYNFNILGITNSPIKGNNGTLEYFAYLNFGKNNIDNINCSYNDYIDVALEKSFLLKSFDKNNYTFDE